MARRGGYGLLVGVVSAIDKANKEQQRQALRNAKDERRRIQLEINSALSQIKGLEKQRLQEERAALKYNRSQLKMGKVRAKELAIQKTDQYLNELSKLEDILKSSIKENFTFNWDSLKNFSEFQEPAPREPFISHLPTKDNTDFLSQKPNPSDPEYIPSYGLLSLLSKSRREKKSLECKKQFDEDLSKWQKEWDRINQENIEEKRLHEEQISNITKEYERSLKEWELKRDEFHNNNKLINSHIDNIKAEYYSKTNEGILGFSRIVLENSLYPAFFPKEFEFEYLEQSKKLIVDYLLPCPEDIPTIKEVKYVASTDKLEEQHISQLQVNNIYDRLIYQVCLRTIFELFSSDSINALDTIVFNGIVESIDPRNGKETSACIVSLQTTKSTFLSINLSQVDPKVCFKSLKGVGSSKLHGLAPIPPIMTMTKDDTRFVSSYAVANNIDTSTNLAAMDWEDFEHLIREIFEKEFSSNGGEVKVTQASRDGGVDAVAFDPDPIRGGKIVIQAKRYTNTVGVSAVRDLYGTVMNEGANKGILVTTSDYGPDSYEFASGKPLVLLNGGNLLHLLDKHGHKAKIDIQEAKKFGLMDIK